MSKLKTLATQTVIYGTSSIVARLINYLLVPFYTRIFVPEEFGVVTEMYAYVAFLIIVLTYGMETAFFRFYDKKNDKDNVFSTILISLITTSIIFVFFASIFSNDIATLLKYPNDNEYIIWFALIVTFDAISSIPFAKLRSHNKAKKFAFIKIVNIIVNVSLNFFLLLICPWVISNDISFLSDIIEPFYSGIGVRQVFIANLISSAITLLLLSPEIIKVHFHFNKTLWKKMIIYASPLLIYGLAGVVNETLDRVLLKMLLPKDISMRELGIYGACYKVAIMMTIIIQAFRYAAEPFFFAEHKNKDAKKTYSEVMTWFVILLSFVFLLIMIYIDYVILFVGKEFRVGVDVIPILLMANLCLGIFYNQSFWYKLTNKTMYGAWLAILGACITIVLNWFWIPVYGYMGSAWATLICYASMVVVSYIFGQKYYPVKYDLKRIFGYLSLSLGLYFISIIIPLDNNGYKITLNSFLIIIFVFAIFVFEKQRLALIFPNLINNQKNS